MTADKPIIRDFYFNTRQIADRLGVSIRRVKRLIKQYDLPVLQKFPNSSYMVSEDDIIRIWLPQIQEKLKKKNPGTKPGR